MSRPAIFLDRDGTIIEDTHYPKEPSQVKFLNGAVTALKKLQQKGFLLFVISNQSGVGRGIIKDDEFKKVHQRFCELLQADKISIEEFAYCFHKPEDACSCRKPETKLIRDLVAQYDIDIKASFTIGDKWSDVLLGFRVGAQGILLGGRAQEEKPAELEGVTVPVFSNWNEVVGYLGSLTPP